MKKIAVILTGCGYLDGSEVTESISTLICLDQKGCDYQVFSPQISAPAVNHSNNNIVAPRNLLDETSRITRGGVKNLKELDYKDFDGLAIPGGYGVAKHLCTWAIDGAKCTVNPDVKLIIQSFHKDSKPILALCIAPVLISKVLGHENITVTIGDHLETSNEIEKTGAIHESCAVDDFVTDRAHKIISSPAYMLDSTPAKVFSGVTKAVHEFFEMC